MVVIDPRKTEKARMADVHLQLRPGTDAFLLAAMLVAYKEAFLGEEARFDRRDDGVPW